MGEWLLAGVALFAVIGLMAGLFSRIFSQPPKKGGKASRLILLTRNSQGCVEGVVRSYSFRRRVRGEPLEIICFDEGSSDDTGPILQRLQKRYPSLDLHLRAEPPYQMDDGRDEASILDLRNRCS
ncbi:hypothetical protein C8P63_105161 [Melghirimyces profundicolus]|uniref:Glycosyl transferase family 2 n=1 Tax=Melghirimyces profundicolus TaxID=1242148 RepID=A0A2T6C2M5_9BACL|nr:hypothetical protein [Melghirimyces profundicolus]PTX62565.1 hypothetical protein C8P63_105161 [Melghirimyces profundicolus]